MPIASGFLNELMQIHICVKKICARIPDINPMVEMLASNSALNNDESRKDRR